MGPAASDQDESAFPRFPGVRRTKRHDMPHRIILVTLVTSTICNDLFASVSQIVISEGAHPLRAAARAMATWSLSGAPVG
jgi:hypothetical protein